MINIGSFKDFIYTRFDKHLIDYEEFKEEVHFAYIDCFPNETYKLVLQITNDGIGFSSIPKIPEVDFSLHDYYIKTNKEAEEFIIQIQKSGWVASPHNL